MQLNPRIASAPLNTRYGKFTNYVFSWSENEQDNVLALVPDTKTTEPLVRVQSACYSGEIFESLDCDCHWQLETSLKMIHDQGGVFIYMLCDGRGAGLLTKIRGMRLTADEGIDTADAYSKLGVPLDPREYHQAVFVLKYLAVSSFRLLTNNPRKVNGMSVEGLSVTRVPLESEPTEFNKSYLASKSKKLGHIMEKFSSK